MVTLQQPEFVFARGEVRPWHEATLHVSAEAVYRGLSVFEGVKAYWNDDADAMGILALPRHYARLRRSAQVLHIPFEHTYEEFTQCCAALLKSLCRPADDMWIRATLYVTEGYWGEDTTSDLVLTAYHQAKVAPEPISLGVSVWRRADDAAQPPRVKSAANYQVARLARIDGRAAGHSEMVLLNSAGRVAEATTACIVIARDGMLLTPTPSEGALESITLDIVDELAASEGISLQRRPIDLTELLIADEVALIGTVAEIVPARRVNTYDVPGFDLLRAVRDRFYEAVRGTRPHASVDLEYVIP